MDKCLLPLSTDYSKRASFILVWASRPENDSHKTGHKATCRQRLNSIVSATLGSANWPEKSGDTQIAHRSEYSAERRKGIRYRMNASVMFHWHGSENEHYQGEGVTRDMSVTGAFVMTATCPPPNAVVQIEVFLPLPDGTSKALMQANMMVLRVEHDNGGNKRSGFSAAGKGFSLRTFSERASQLVHGLIRESKESMGKQE